MRELRDVLHEAGPARVSEGFGDRVLARLREGDAPAPVVRLEPRARSRRTSLTIVVQAASLVALLFTYGALLAATRVHDVGERWEDTKEESAEPASGARLETATTTLLASAFVVVPPATDACLPVARTAVPAARKLLIPLLPPRGASV
jgi:hypothetical protein